MPIEETGPVSEQNRLGAKLILLIFLASMRTAPNRFPELDS